MDAILNAVPGILKTTVSIFAGTAGGSESGFVVSVAAVARSGEDKESARLAGSGAGTCAIKLVVSRSRNRRCRMFTSRSWIGYQKISEYG